MFFAVTLPLAARGIAAGLVLAFARAIGEFGATILVAGNIPGRTTTLALKIYEARNSDRTRPPGACRLSAWSFPSRSSG